MQTKNKTLDSHIASTAVLMINLGTPDAPNTPEVRTYLRELLSSDRVLDINPFLRWLLLNIFILPFRPKKTAKAYKKIWLEGGSPLMVYSQKMKKALAEQFATGWVRNPWTSPEKIYNWLGVLSLSAAVLPSC